jgi:hypothetical protein
MKKKTVIIISIMSWIFCLWSGNLLGTAGTAGTAGAPQEISREKIKQVMERYDYINWDAGNGKVIPGVKISENILQKFNNIKMKRAWKKDISSMGKVEGIPYSIIRKYWKSEDNNSLLDVTMVVAPTSEAARKFLIMRYAASQIGPSLVKPAGRDLGIDIGKTCFVTGTGEMGNLSSIDFIRDNVVIMMKAEGSFRSKLEPMARELDERLLQEPPADNFSQLKETPIITRFSCERITIKPGESVPLHLEVNNPKQRELRYSWNMSGGGVEKDGNGNFFYYGGEEGKHTITVTVLNDVGLHYSRTLEIEVTR